MIEQALKKKNLRTEILESTDKVIMNIKKRNTQQMLTPQKIIGCKFQHFYYYHICLLNVKIKQ